MTKKLQQRKTLNQKLTTTNQKQDQKYYVIFMTTKANIKLSLTEP